MYTWFWNQRKVGFSVSTSDIFTKVLEIVPNYKDEPFVFYYSSWTWLHFFYCTVSATSKTYPTDPLCSIESRTTRNTLVSIRQWGCVRMNENCTERPVKFYKFRNNGCKGDQDKRSKIRFNQNQKHCMAVRVGVLLDISIHLQFKLCRSWEAVSKETELMVFFETKWMVFILLDF